MKRKLKGYTIQKGDKVSEHKDYILVGNDNIQYYEAFYTDYWVYTELRNGNKVFEKNASGLETYYTWCPHCGKCTSYRDNKGSWVTNSYNKEGLVTSYATFTGYSSISKYNKNNKKVYYRNSKGKEWSRSFNKKGEVVYKKVDGNILVDTRNILEVIRDFFKGL